MADLCLSNVNIQVKLFGTNKQPLPSNAQSLCKDLRRIGQGRRVIPPMFKDLVEKLDEELYMIEEDNMAPVNGPEEEWHDGEWQTKMFWQKVVDIQENALECQEECLSEAA